MSQLNLEEVEMSDDPKFRNYSNAIDKALKTFEYTSEWADLIAALGKLNKVLQSNSKYSVIPRKVVIAKRLAQCLHPALPSGVHLKALETYDLIFKLIGHAKLASELFIFSAGLYPLLAHAAINIRPVLLRLYEVHLVPIIEFLKPGLSGLLSGVLPGLEEGSDHFDQTVILLDKICDGITSSVFYGSLWKCMAENPQVRLPSFIYILSRFDRKKSVDAQLEILGDNLDIMIHSLCSSLEDANVLVQRNALEFLLAAFPLHGSHLLKSDLTRLLASSVTTLLRRDMSLNRRLFSWILGNEQQNQSADDVHSSTVTSSESVSKIDPTERDNYFLRHSKTILTEALYYLLKSSYCSKPCDMRAYKVLTFLLEKPEVGPAILDEILMEIFRSLYIMNASSFKVSGKSADYEELVKTTNLLYNILEESYIWSYIGRALQNSAQIDAEGSEVQEVGVGAPTFQEMCKLTSFLLDILPVESNKEMQIQFLPCLLSKLSKLLCESQSSMSYLALLTGLELCLLLLKKTVPSHETSDVSYVKNCAPFQSNEISEVTNVCTRSAILSAQMQKKYLESAANGIQMLFVKLLSIGLCLEQHSLYDAAQVFTFNSSPNSASTLEEMLDIFLKKDEDHRVISSDEMNFKNAESSHALVLSGGFMQGQDFEQLILSLKSCCSMLKELSTFPIYSSDGALRNGVDYDKNWSNLPKWLQLLCIACCHLPNEKSPTLLQLHITTTSTLLDLTASTLSMLPSKFWKSEHFQRVTDHANLLEETSSSHDVVSIVLLPVVTPTYLVTLFKSTRVYQLLAKQLWEGLGSAVNTQQQYAELLHQLHTMAPACISNVVEDVLLEDLSGEFEHSDISSDALNKFTVLWQTSRSLDPAKWGCRRLRTFDRCLFFMFDWLSSEVPSVSRSTSEGWLVQNLIRNDISRLLDPLFVMLLKPHSARISIRHAILNENNPANNANHNLRHNCEDAVHAISSVDGHVVYHVSDSRIQRRPFNRTVMTLGLSSEGRAPESYVDRKLAFPWQVPEQYLTDQTMELFINPFPDEHLNEAEKAKSESEPVVSDENISKDDSVILVKSLLTELIDSVVNKAIASAAAARSKRKDTIIQEKPSSLPSVHSHILLYCQVSDAHQTLYVLKILRHLLLSQPRLMLLNLASTGLTSNRSPNSALILELLARHRKCLSGKGFHGEVSGDWVVPHRSSMYLEVVLSILLSLQRSFYSNMGLSSLNRSEIMSNRQVQLAAMELLTLILTELLPMVRDLGKGFASFVSDLLVRCRVQKIALQCTVSVLQIVTAEKAKVWKENSNSAQHALIHGVFSFNEGRDNLNFTYSEASLASLIKQLFSVIALEDQIWKSKPVMELLGDSTQKGESERYERGLPLHAQPLLATAIHTALKQRNVRWIHTEFSQFLVSSLPLMERSLPKMLSIVVPQVCLNLESVCSQEQEVTRADYLMCELEALTALCHYAINDCSSSGLFSLTNSAGILGGTICGSWAATGAGHTNSSLLHNLVQSLTPDLTASKNGASDTDPLSLSRKQILSTLPKILSCARYLWQMSGAEQSKVLRQKLLELLTPIGQLHGTNLLSAVSLVWVEKTNCSKYQKIIRKVLPEPTQEQSVLVDLIGSVKVLVPDTIVQLLRQVLKQPAQARTWRYETALLHFLYCYLSKVSKQQLGECWNSFLQLLRDLSTMAPPLLFSGLVIFEEALQRYQTPGERKDQRELQEVCTKLLEACGSLAAACLEQTTWLRRNLTVKRETLAVTTPGEEDDCPNDTDPSVFSTLNDEPNESSLPSSKTSLYSVQALIVLAELLAPLQDLVFPSQDKERVIPLLTSLLANVIPYLKHHSHSNIHGMRAAAEMVSSLSNYPATRRAWRKDTFDLLFDHQFFAVDAETLRHWRNIIDNLMSHDKDAFREFLNRVSASPSGLFSSRDQEVENRTMMLKRLAFVLFATEGDQYQRYLPDILEKLSETLRLYQTWPALQAQVFVCFRVLLLRLSHHHVTSLWPSVIAETVQVLSLLENELRRDLNENSSSHARRASSLDVSNAGNGLYTNGCQSGLQLFLSACKLVYLVLALPASRLQQFQMYRWAFVGDQNSLVDSSEIRASPQSNPTFIPYLTRIYSLLKNKTEISEQPSIRESANIPTIGNIKNLNELLPLFQVMDGRDLRNVSQEDITVQSMERLLEFDFLEPIPP